MMRLLRQYGLVVVLTVSLVVPLTWPVLGPALSHALSLPTQNFSQLQDLTKVADQLRGTPKEAQDLTQGIVDQQLAGKGVRGAIDVAAVVQKGDLSSIYAIQGLTALEKSALVQNVEVVYRESGQLIDRSKLLSSRAAAIHQPGDGEGGGFTSFAASALANSSQDVLSDLEQYGGVLEKTQKQLDTLKQLWEVLGVVLNLKPVFLPEKPDNDTNIVCINYVPGGQLYPQLLTSFGSFSDLNGMYGSILSQVTTSIQRRTNIGSRLTDLTSMPLTFPELALTENLDYSKLLEAGRSSVGRAAQGVATSVTSRYGAGMAGVGDLADVSKLMRSGADMAAAAASLESITTELADSLGTRNRALLDDLAAGKPNALPALKQALGPQGAPLLNRYESLSKSRGRAGDAGRVDEALRTLGSGIGDQLDAQAATYLQQMGGARALAESFAGKNPSELMADAQKAYDRVATRAGDNLDNTTSLVTRLTDRKNYQETMSAGLDTMKSQEGDFQYLTNLGKILNYKEILKLPTF